MSADRYDAFLERLEKSEVALPADLEGCAASEIAALEEKYGVRLPTVYKRFLRSMGHQCGWLFASDQVMVEYRAVLDLTEELRSSLTNEDPELAMRIPPDAFFILTTGDDVDLFVGCEDGDDPPVYQLNTPQRTIELAYGSVTEWIEAGLETAKEAIADGYFEAVSMPRKYDNTPRPEPKAPVEPLPYTLLCPGCGQRLEFCTWSGEHSRYLDFGFLYNDVGTSTLVWAAFDPAYQALFGQEMPWDLSPEQQTAFEARLKPAPAGGSWRFSNYPRCPHCKAAVSRPMTKDDTCLIYEGSLVLGEQGEGAGLKQALVEGATGPVSAPKAMSTPGRHELPCSGCGARIPFDLPTTDDTRLQNLAFLYNDSGTATLVWATTDPTYRSMFGNIKPWELSDEQQAAFEARLKPAPTGGQWRFANFARCPRCDAAISPPMADPVRSVSGLPPKPPGPTLDLRQQPEPCAQVEPQGRNSMVSA